MTINDTSTTRVQISAGSTITITNLEIQDATQVLVTKTDSAGVETTLVITTDYTVNSDLDTVTLNVALAASELATATLNVPNTQETDYINFDDLNSETVETALDKVTLKNKQQQEILDRTVKFNISTDDTNLELADPTGNGDKYIKLNDDATGFEYATLSSSAGLGNIVEDISPQLGGDLDTNGFNINVGISDYIIFEGSTADAFETTLDVVDPTADRTVKLPDATDTLVGKATTDTLTNKTITAAANTLTIASTDLSDTADLTYNADTDVSGNTWVLDEDAMGSDSNTKVPTQQSVKAYVDANIGKTTGDTVQVVNVTDSAVATGTTTMPRDDTIPQNTEGDEYMTLSITPTSTSNKLLIEVEAFVTISAIGSCSMALFQDSTAGALAATNNQIDTATAGGIVTLRYYMTAGTTSSTTFKVRMAPNTGTLTFNGASGSRLYGGVAASSITITEIEV